MQLRHRLFETPRQLRDNLSTDKFLCQGCHGAVDGLAVVAPLYAPRPAKVRTGSDGVPVAVGAVGVESVREEWLVEDRCNGTLTMLDSEMQVIATYTFVNGWPSKYTPASMNAGQDQAAVEEITIAVEEYTRV